MTVHTVNCVNADLVCGMRRLERLVHLDVVGQMQEHAQRIFPVLVFLTVFRRI